MLSKSFFLLTVLTLLVAGHLRTGAQESVPVYPIPTFVIEEENTQAAHLRIAIAELRELLCRRTVPETADWRARLNEALNTREIPVLAKAPPTETQFDLPTAGQQGRALEIRGPFDGDPGTTQISIDCSDLMVLAESPRGVVARNPSGQTVGLSNIQLIEKDRMVTGPFRTLGIQLSAPKLDLLTGEQTTLAIKVTGLAGLKTAIPLDLENKSSGVIQMGGGNSQRINISAAMAEGGTYVTERPLIGIQRGAFTITGTVVADRQRPEESPSLAGGPLMRWAYRPRIPSAAPAAFPRNPRRVPAISIAHPGPTARLRVRGATASFSGAKRARKAMASIVATPGRKISRRTH